MTMWHEQQLAAARLDRPEPGSDVGFDGAEPSGWVAWLLFAGTMLVMLGAFQAILGLVELLENGFFAGHGQLVVTDFRTWGVTHLVLAAVALGTGVGLMLGLAWARVVGVILCVLNVVIGFAFLGASPWWAALLIAFSVITAYAITVHGGEIEESLEE